MPFDREAYRKAYDKNRYEANRERRKAEMRERYEKGKREGTYVPSRWIQSGGTLEEYDGILSVQNGKCGICSCDRALGRSKQYPFDWDHNPSTGFRRGLLCHPCNTKLRNFEYGTTRDIIPDWQKAAEGYLAMWSRIEQATEPSDR